MKKFTELSFTERQEIMPLFTNWLRPYTHEAILRVAPRIDEILNDEHAMHLITELNNREQKCFEELGHDLAHLFDDFETFKEFDIHNHPLEHPGAYRDVLYDLYIR